MPYGHSVTFETKSTRDGETRRSDLCDSNMPGAMNEPQLGDFRVGGVEVRHAMQNERAADPIGLLRFGEVCNQGAQCDRLTN